MRTRIPHRAGALFVAAALALALSSCSQSVEDGCGIAEGTLTEATSDIKELVTQSLAGEDAAEPLARAAEALEDAKAGVKNSEVSEALETLGTELESYSTTVRGLEMPDLGEIDYTSPEALSQLEDVQSQFSEQTDSLREGAASLGEASDALRQL